MKKVNRYQRYALILSILLGSLTERWSHSHQGHHHPVPQNKEPETQQGHPHMKLKKINEDYVTKIKPIFLKKCMDCHGGPTRYPWYYKIPGIKQAIDSDIQEAKKHLDFSNDFPFKSHASIQQDLNAVRNSVMDELMPPFSYRILHPSTKVSDAEKKMISNWVADSLKILENSDNGNSIE